MMTKLGRILVLAVMCAAMLPLAAQAGELDDFVKNLSIEASADPSGFKYRLHSQFEVAGATVDVVLTNVSDPADAYMVLKVGEVTGKAPEEVLEVYKAHKGKGWGVIAKELGIKPGSPEFQALKTRSAPVKSAPGGKGKGHK